LFELHAVKTLRRNAIYGSNEQAEQDEPTGSGGHGLMSGFGAFSPPGAVMSVEWSNDEPTWLITLSDLTLLLVCFLALWYVKDFKLREVTSAPVTAAVVNAASTGTDAVPIVASSQPEEWEALHAEMEDLIAETGLGRDVNLEKAPGHVVISIRDTVSFASGKADLRRRALPILDKVAVLISSRPALVLEVSGHTDRRRIATPKFPSNWELSSARASRVARYLIDKGIDPSRIAVQGYASERPRVPESNLDSARANRRVEIRLYHPADAKSALLN
jgi:chemotaxis protein MotB